MQEGSGSGIFADHFGEMLSRAGIGTSKIGPESSAVGTVHIVNGRSLPANFSEGTAMSMKKYQRTQKK